MTPFSPPCATGPETTCKMFISPSSTRSNRRRDQDHFRRGSGRSCKLGRLGSPTAGWLDPLQLFDPHLFLGLKPCAIDSSLRGLHAELGAELGSFLVAAISRQVGKIDVVSKVRASSWQQSLVNLAKSVLLPPSSKSWLA